MVETFLLVWGLEITLFIVLLSSDTFSSSFSTIENRLLNVLKFIEYFNLLLSFDDDFLNSL